MQRRVEVILTFVHEKSDGPHLGTLASNSFWRQMRWRTVATRAELPIESGILIQTMAPSKMHAGSKTPGEPNILVNGNWFRADHSTVAEMMQLPRSRASNFAISTR